MRTNHFSRRAAGVLLLMTMLSPGCRDNLSSPSLVRELRQGGQCLSSSLSVASSAAFMPVKSAYGGNPDIVSDWCLFQFDGTDGLLAGAYYQPSGADLAGIRVLAGRTYDWYAVANVGDIREAFAVGVTTAAAMASWLAEGIDMRVVAALPMAWTGTALSFSKSDLANGRKLEVKLTRLVAKLDVVLDKRALRTYAFTATSVTVEGPDAVRPFAAAGSRATGLAVTTDAATASDLARLNGGDAVTFYPAENRYGDLLPENVDPWKKLPARIGPDDHPSFLEIAGIATLQDGSQLTIPLKYRFYLGRDNVRNFDVIRNTASTVTLHLTDAAIQAALEERDRIEGGEAPEPLWKVESGPFPDDRCLRFEHGTANGGTGTLRIPFGSTAAEGVVLSPAGLQYRLQLDRTLLDGGVRVYLDAACTVDVTPAPGETADLPAGTAMLFFRLPAGGSAVSGQARIRTMDGRKTDDLAVCGPAGLAGLEITPGLVHLPSAPTWASNSAWSQSTHLSLIAHFTDGSTADITAFDDVTWTILRQDYNAWSNRVKVGDDYVYFFRSGNGRQPLYGVYETSRVGTHDGETRFLLCSFKSADVTQNGSYFGGTVTGIERTCPLLPCNILTASWTFNGVTKEAGLMGIADYGTPAALELTPASASVRPGETVEFAPAVVFDNGLRLAWSEAKSLVGPGDYNYGYDRNLLQNAASSDADHVAVKARENPGTTIYTVSYTKDGVTVSGSAEVTVTGWGTLQRLKVTPKETHGATSGVDLTATATFSDGIRDVTSFCEWSSSTYGIAVSNGHLGRYAGRSTTVTASYTHGGVTKTDDAFVSWASADHGAVTGIALQQYDGSSWTTGDGIVPLGGTQRIRLVSVYADGYTDTRSLSQSMLTVPEGASRISWDGDPVGAFTATATGTVVLYASDLGMTSNTLRFTITEYAGPYYRFRVVLDDAAIAHHGSTFARVYYETSGNGAGWTMVEEITGKTGTELVVASAEYATNAGLTTVGGVAKFRLDGCNNDTQSHTVHVSADNRSYAATGRRISQEALLAVGANIAPTLSVMPDRLQWQYWQHTSSPKTVSVSSNVPWTVAFVSDSDHFHSGPASGNGSGTVTVCPDEPNFAAAARTAVIRITTVSDPVMTADVTLQQGAYLTDVESGSQVYAKLLITSAVPHVSTSPSATSNHFVSEIGAGGTVEYHATYSVYSDAAMQHLLHSETDAPYFYWESGDYSVLRQGPEGMWTRGCYVSEFTGANVFYGINAGTADQGPVSVSVSWGSWHLHPSTAKDQASVTVKGNAVDVTYGDFLLAVTVSPGEIGYGDAATAAAVLSWREYHNGAASTVTGSRDVTAATSFVAVTNGSYVSRRGNAFTNANTTSEDRTATIRGTLSGYDLEGTAVPTCTGDASLQLVHQPVRTESYNYGGYALAVTVMPAEIGYGATAVASAALSWTKTTHVYYDGVEAPGEATRTEESADVTASTQFEAITNGDCVARSGNRFQNVSTATDNRTVTIRGSLPGYVHEGNAVSLSATAALTLTVPELTGLAFDSEHYELVRVVAGTVSVSCGFTVTAQYGDGTRRDVTADAVYDGPGDVIVDPAAGTLTARSVCSGKTLSASYGGRTARATCSATDLEVPVTLTGVHFESQGDQSRSFLIDSFVASFRRVLSGETREADVSSAVSVALEGPLVHEDPADGWFRFHFTEAGSGTLTFSYACNGVTVVRILDVTCSETHRITYAWR